MYFDRKKISVRELYGEGLRFVVRNDNINLINNKTFYAYALNGDKLTTLDISNIANENDDVFTDISVVPTGEIVLAYSSFNPKWDINSNRYCYDDKVVLSNRNEWKPIGYNVNICSRIISIVQTKFGFVAADNDTIYIFDKDLNLTHKEELGGTLLGIVDIERIVLDNSESFLFLLDRRYGRILKYDLNAKELTKPTVVP
jgi:hypothetical protein